ncbi:MAG: NFACT family protein [Clostridia bacterium]|nr:NFACT family protein [Clostridia bacterium]
MALDGALLCCLRQELSARLADTKTDKIFQPSREELILQLRGRRGTERLYFSVRASSPRVHLTGHAPENPAVPPRFCMLLRKRLTGGRLTGLRQKGLERALHFDFACLNELGDPVQLTLIIEMMGRHSNVILVGPDGRIIDALRRVDFAMSSVRPVLPGLPYEDPPAEPDRLDPSAVPAETFCRAVLAHTGLPLEQALQQTAHGFSPLICREIAFRALRGSDARCGELTADQRDRLLFFVRAVQQAVLTGEGRVPYLLTEKGSPKEFSFFPILQYGLTAVGREEADFSSLLDGFYAGRDAEARHRQNTGDLLKVLSAAANRLTRKIARQQEELAQCAQRDQKRLYGDLLTAGAHTVPRGAAYADLVNYYDEACATVRIPLDPALSAAANAQKYYKEYRKAQTAAVVLRQQIERGQEELRYIDSVFDALSRAESSRETEALRQELIAAGYMHPVKGRQKLPPPAPMHFVSDDGYDVYVGRNNVQNDQLTLKTARGCDWWFHTKNVPGAHVIVTAADVPPDTTLTQAAILAATFSGAGKSGASVEVDYTQAKHVRKPANARPGLVIYDNNRTAVVRPDPELAARLKKE